MIAGPNAKYKGTGTINGTGDYGFMLTACDAAVNGTCQGGDLDTFRIKIWDRSDDGTVVFDNKLDEPDEANSGTVLGGGNIKVHESQIAPSATRRGGQPRPPLGYSGP